MYIVALNQPKPGLFATTQLIWMKDGPWPSLCIKPLLLF